MKRLLHDNWYKFLESELNKEYFSKLESFIESEYATKTIFPEYQNIFRAFNLLNPEDVKVVILGQDPYHGLHQANGLAFSVCDSCKVPPSLRNIYKELVDDLSCSMPKNGNLTSWAEQGVLMINSVLTVEEAKANSHKQRGWEIFTDSVIQELSCSFEHIVFVLWGGASQQKEKLIDGEKHLILKSSHPSPLSAYRGFLGSKPFSKTNQYLVNHSKKKIKWCLTPQQTLL